VPAYISFISGVSLEQLRNSGSEASRKNVMVTSLIFIAGFSTLFVLLGASATYAGQFLLKNRSCLTGLPAQSSLFLACTWPGFFRSSS